MPFDFVCAFSSISAYYSDICVGSIACRVEKKDNGAVCVYIMTLGVLAPYRGLGIGKQAISLPLYVIFALGIFVKPKILYHHGY